MCAEGKFTLLNAHKYMHVYTILRARTMTTRGSTRRRLFSPGAANVHEQEVRLCSLCYSQHQHLSLPSSWKSEAAQLLIRSMHIEFDAPTCRPCRDDISRLVKNQQYIPRWTKATQKTCCVPGCNETIFAHAKMASQAKLLSIVNRNGQSMHESQIFPTPTPLCKVHYHMVYNESQPTQTHCVTCGSDLRKSSVRTCPDPERIQEYLAEKTGFDGEISSGTKVCFPCYKFHLCILKEDAAESKDVDLIAIIDSLKGETLPLKAINNMPTAINQAMTESCIHVANTLLQQKALILPAVHQYFSEKIKVYATAANLEGKEEHVTAHWILRNLVSRLGIHLSYACRMRKCGTLLYRTNGDLLKSLTLSLQLLREVEETMQMVFGDGDMPYTSSSEDDDNDNA